MIFFDLNPLYILDWMDKVYRWLLNDDCCHTHIRKQIDSELQTTCNYFNTILMSSNGHGLQTIISNVNRNLWYSQVFLTCSSSTENPTI